MPRKAQPDEVDRIIGLWKRERPDLDYSAPAVIIRLHRASHSIRILVDRFFENHGLSTGDFEVLASLRRIGRPYELPQHELMRHADKTSGTMTFRINRLEKQGLVERRRDSSDARVQRVALTAQGTRLCDQLLPAHLRNEAKILGALDRGSRERLATLLRRLLRSLEREGWATPVRYRRQPGARKPS